MALEMLARYSGNIATAQQSETGKGLMGIYEKSEFSSNGLS
jgi:hypothetical protein